MKEKYKVKDGAFSVTTTSIPFSFQIVSEHESDILVCAAETQSALQEWIQHFRPCTRQDNDVSDESSPSTLAAAGEPPSTTGPELSPDEPNTIKKAPASPRPASSRVLSSSSSTATSSLAAKRMAAQAKAAPPSLAVNTDFDREGHLQLCTSVKDGSEESRFWSRKYATLSEATGNLSFFDEKLGYVLMPAHFLRHTIYNALLFLLVSEP